MTERERARTPGSPRTSGRQYGGEPLWSVAEHLPSFLTACVQLENVRAGGSRERYQRFASPSLYRKIIEYKCRLKTSRWVIRGSRLFSKFSVALALEEMMRYMGPRFEAAPLQTAVPARSRAFPLASALIAMHSFSMREILPGIFTWGSIYAGRPWDLNGYAIALTEGTLLIDPPAPEEADWRKLPTPITTVVLTNRDHVRDAPLFRARYGARIVASKDEISQFTSLPIDATVQEGDLIGSALRVIHLPGKSPGEIGLYLEPAYHAASRDKGGILILGDAIIGNPPGALGLIPEEKLDDPKRLRKSLPKILDYQFEVLLLCDGQSVLSNAKQKVSEFLSRLSC